INLHEQTTTITEIIKKHREEQSTVQEKYEGTLPTEKSSSMADEIRQRHGLLVNFLRLLGADEKRAQKDTEGLEHYIDSRTLQLLARLVEYASKNPQWWNQFQKQPESV